MVWVNLGKRPYFAPAIPGSARPTSGKRRGTGEGIRKGGYIFFLTSHNFSSLVIDTLCDEAGESDEDIAVACFYFDFAAQREQSAVSMMSALLKQVVAGFKTIPEEIMDAFQRHGKVIGGRTLQLPEVTKLLGGLSSTRRTFFCLDALDECPTAERSKVLQALKGIIRMSPATRVFLTGRPHVGNEVGKHLPGGAVLVSISPRKDDIVRYINAKLSEDPSPDEMNEELGAEIVKTIPETITDM